MKSILGRLDELESGETGSNEVPDLLRKYILGADYVGKDIFDILDWEKDIDGHFKNDPNSITDAHDTVIYLNELWEDYKWDEIQNGYIYIKYNNVGYKIKVDYEYDSINDEVICTTKDVEKVYEPNGMEGQVVGFKAKATDEEVTNWVVLYDNGEMVDITPVWPDDDWWYNIGYADPAAADALPTGTDLERAIWSYNHLVDTLNDFCGTLVTNISSEDGEMVRSAGAGFEAITDVNKIMNASNKYSSTFLENNPEGEEGNYNGVGLKGDLEGEQDIIRMSYYIPEINNEAYGVPHLGNCHLLASRSVSEFPYNVSFNIRYEYPGPHGDYCYSLWMAEGIFYGQGYTYGVRPVVRVLKSSLLSAVPFLEPLDDEP